MNRPGCYQPERQLLDGIRTRQTEAPFHGAHSLKSVINANLVLTFSRLPKSVNLQLARG